MGKMTKDEIINILERNDESNKTADGGFLGGNQRAVYVQYADAFLEYQEATENIEKNGLIVSHPRTMNPVENPYMSVRDRALKKLQMFRGVDSRGLW